jgi:hypothetical protein
MRQNHAVVEFSHETLLEVSKHVPCSAKINELPTSVHSPKFNVPLPIKAQPNVFGGIEDGTGIEVWEVPTSHSYRILIDDALRVVMRDRL